MKFSIYFLILAATASGCQTVVDINVPLEERKIVVNATVDPDSTWTVDLSLSKHVLDNEGFFATPPTGLVQILDAETGEQVEQLTFATDDLRYHGTSRPQPAKGYILQADIPGYQRVAASGRVPEVITIERLEIDSTKQDENGPYTQIDVTFNDPGGVKNFYSVSVLINYYYIMNSTDTVWYERQVYIERLSNSLETDSDRGPELFTDDIFFNGRSFTWSFRVQGYYGGYYGGPYYPNGGEPKVRVVLSSLGESLYKYKTTIALQRSVDGDPFAQPVLVYGNVQNGLGLFDGITRSVWKIN